LRDLGHHVLVVAPDGGVGEFEGVPIIGMKGWSCPMYPELRLAPPRASLRNALREFKPDLIHVADPALLGIADSTIAAAKRVAHCACLWSSRITQICPPTFTTTTRISRASHLAHPAYRHNRATVNLCTSHAMFHELIQHGIERVAFWPGGVDTNRFCPGRSSAAVRERLTGGNPDSPLLLYVGRLSPEKGLERLKPMLEAIPGARLALVGDDHTTRRSRSTLPECQWSCRIPPRRRARIRVCLR